MAVSYQVAIDRDDDGDFSGPGEDITSDVLALDWQLGMHQPYDSMARPGTARIIVRNETQHYSPEITTLQPGQVVRIQSHDGSTTRTHFTGHLTHIEPQPGDQGQRTAIIHAVDALRQLEQHRIRLPPQVSTHAGAIIEAILQRVPFRRHTLRGYWLLGRAGHGELGTHTRLPGANISRSLEPGLSLFHYVGDTWGDGIAASAAIRQVTEAERGRFFINREGQAVFYNRHHLLRDKTTQTSFADDMAGLSYSYGAQVISRVQVRLLPRSIGPDGATLWTLESPQRIRASTDAPLALVARFRDDQQQPAGALHLIAPVPRLDYMANTAEDGSGTDLTDQVDVVLRQADFSAAVLEIHSRAGQDAYLLEGARLRGTPVFLGDPLLLEQISYGSQALYSTGALLFDLPTLDSVPQAEALARYELARRKTPRGHIHHITLSRADHATPALARTLFDRITITESQTGHSGDYFIVAEAHTVDLGGYRHQVTWMLESAAANAFWLLGHSRLNQDTVLAY